MNDNDLMMYAGAITLALVILVAIGVLLGGAKR
jgi:hypothetical protein